MVYTSMLQQNGIQVPNLRLENFIFILKRNTNLANIRAARVKEDNPMRLILGDFICSAKASK